MSESQTRPRIEVVAEDLRDEAMRRLAQGEIVLDLGGGSPFQKELGSYRAWFQGTKYICVDRDGDGNPDVVADICALPFPEGYADGVICNSVLEHVENPFQAVAEMHRVLKSGGVAFVFVPFLHPYHGSDRYPDFFRFTSDGLIHLFGMFRHLTICPTEGYIGVVLRFATGFHPLGRHLMWIQRPAERLVSLFRGRPPSRLRQASGYQLLALK